MLYNLRKVSFFRCCGGFRALLLVRLFARHFTAYLVFFAHPKFTFDFFVGRTPQQTMPDCRIYR